MRRLFLGAAALGLAAVAAFKLAIEPWWRAWGVRPDETAAPLPGDDLVPDADASETRGIEIAAAPASVWPWLVQMGHGRAGWYSYDRIDMDQPSVRRIVPEWQELQVGDLMPVAPGAGFAVRELDPGRALVLYVDDAMVHEQAEQAEGDATVEAVPANLKVTGALMEGAQPSEFRASWAFVLVDLGGGRTRLVERVRTRFGPSDKPWTRFTLPMMGFGVFIMIRRQLLGIQERVEASSPIEVPVAA